MGLHKSYYGNDAEPEQKAFPKIPSIEDFEVIAPNLTHLTLPELQRHVSDMSDSDIQNNLQDILMVIISNLNEAQQSVAIHCKGIRANMSVDLHKGGDNA